MVVLQALVEGMVLEVHVTNRQELETGSTPLVEVYTQFGSQVYMYAYMRLNEDVPDCEWSLELLQIVLGCPTIGGIVPDCPGMSHNRWYQEHIELAKQPREHVIPTMTKSKNPETSQIQSWYPVLQIVLGCLTLGGIHVYTHGKNSTLGI